MIPTDTRLFTASITIFDREDPEGPIPMERNAKLMDHHIRNGSEGLVLGGTTGENPAVDDDEDIGFNAAGQAERMSYYLAMLQHIAGRVPVIVNGGTNSTRHSLWRMQHIADELGDLISAIMAVIPYYNKAARLGIVRHFIELAKAIYPMPIVIYLVKGRTVVTADVEMLREIVTSIDNKVIIKYADGDISECLRIRMMLDQERPDARILSGDDPTAITTTLTGATDGAIAVVSHWEGVADQYAEGLHAAVHGDVGMARRINKWLLPLANAAFVNSSPLPTKHGLWLQGFDPIGSRGPNNVTLEESARFDKIDYPGNVRTAMTDGGLHVVRAA